MTLLETQKFGTVAHVDVGALAIGRICQHHGSGTSFARGQEKGYFGFGGSTIVLPFTAGTIRVDADIESASARSVETLVRLGEKIASASRGRR